MANPRKTLKQLERRTAKAAKRSRKRPKKKQFSFGKYILLPIVLVTILVGIWHYRYALYYLAFQRTQEGTEVKLAPLTTRMRNFDVLQHHQDKLYGIDISHYQGRINWKKVAKIQDSFPISFVFIRATAGKTRTDRKFKRNWKLAKEKGFVRGAYHYYRPDENSLEQAYKFIKTVKLKPGDLPPVLDIEDIPRVQSMDRLKVGLKRWLNTVEKHYGIKPILYSGESFYNDFLYQEFAEYTCWIANYNYYVERIDKDWQFWQFTDKGSVRGIKEFVDLNIYNGSLKELKSLAKR